MFKRILRLTSYSNPNDSVLAASNAKGLGVAPRVGRVGLPADANSKAINVDCGEYFRTLNPRNATCFGNWTHSWHIGNRVFARDLAMTIEGRHRPPCNPDPRDGERSAVAEGRPAPALHVAMGGQGRSQEGGERVGPRRLVGP